MRRAQTNLSTSFLREILLLRVARQVLAPQATPLRILSFGCSIGEELVTLRVLFPEAEIFGCDIDPLALKVAQARVGHLATVFKSDEAAIAARGPFDLICAFSSLCINPMPPAAVMQRQLPFSLFDDLVATLDANLRTGGLLCLRDTSYIFADLALSHRYGRIRTDLVFENGFVPQLRPDGAPACRVVPRQFTNLLQRGVLDGLEDWDLIDTVFRKMPAPALAPEVTFHSMVPSLPDPGEPLASWSYSTLDGWDGPPEEVLEIQRHYRLQRDPKNPDQSEVVGTLRRQSFRGQGWLTFMLEPRSIPA